MKKATFPLKTFFLLFIFLLYGVLQVKQAVNGLSQNKPGKMAIEKEKLNLCDDFRVLKEKNQEAITSGADKKPAQRTSYVSKPGPEFFFYDWSVFSLLIIS